jgi:hypothetical protein
VLQSGKLMLRKIEHSAGMANQGIRFRPPNPKHGARYVAIQRPGEHGEKRVPRTVLKQRSKGALCLTGVIAAVLAVAGSATLYQQPARAAVEPAAAGGLPGFRRLNEAQYIRSIAQIFGEGITVPGRFDPPLREAGLMAIGDGKATLSASGIEQYELRAREIAAQVLSDGRRGKVAACASGATKVFDEACAREFFDKYGRLLYRRPLVAHETAALLVAAQSATQKNANFAKGLETGLSRLLVSPNFLFRVDDSVADPVNPSVRRLDDYSLATRISFFLWDAPPDVALLDATARGDLRDPAKLAKQVDRLMASPRFEQGVRSFFSDMFGYEQFSGLAKDQAIYPKFNSELVRDAQEQALRTLIDQLITRKGDYRDLFTTKATFLNRNLGALYKVPVTTAGMEGWAPYTFAEKDPRAGILSFAAFLMLDPTHEGRSSPTIRGKSVRELLLCQQVPQPPANVNFAIVQDTHNPDFKTARQRLKVHMENPACAGCHALTDPIGLAMENYDAIGDFRTHENGALIDAKGTFNGKPYTGLLGFSQLLRDSEEAPSCLVQRVFEYGVGRESGAGDAKWLEYSARRFVADKYRLPALMRFMATSDAFRVVATEQTSGGAQVVAVRRMTLIGG